MFALRGTSCCPDRAAERGRNLAPGLTCCPQPRRLAARGSHPPPPPKLLALLPSGREPEPRPFADDLALELSDGRQHAENQLAHRVTAGPRIDPLASADEPDAAGLHQR